MAYYCYGKKGFCEEECGECGECEFYNGEGGTDINDNSKFITIVKREVAREIFEDIDLNLEDYIRGDIRGNAMVARLYSLKKKYTEGE